MLDLGNPRRMSVSVDRRVYQSKNILRGYDSNRSRTDDIRYVSILRSNFQPITPNQLPTGTLDV